MWASLRRRARRWADAVPVTPRGLGLAGASAAGLGFYGYGQLDLVAFALGVSGIALLLLAAGAVGGSALWLRRQAPAARGELGILEAGRSLRTGFRLPSLTRVPLVQIDWCWLDPDSVECRVEPGSDGHRERVRPRERGAADAVRRRVVCRDAFGLSAVAWEHREATPLLVLPDPGALRRVPALRSLAAGDDLADSAGAPEGDRLEIRRYAPGDPARDILWKSYARNRQLNVRLRERSVERARRTLAYLVAGPEDEPAAAAARVALESGALGAQWRFGADGGDAPCERLDQALALVARSRAARARGGAGLGAFLREAGDAHCVVFAPAHPGPWVSAVQAAARARARRLTVVLAADGIEGAEPARPWWRRLLYREPLGRGVDARRIAQLAGSLGTSGSSLLLVDRRNGSARRLTGRPLEAAA